MGEVVVIGDVHVGSNYAVFPEKFVNPESGNVIEANEWQLKLLDYWKRFAEEIKPEIIVLLGDLVEGPQSREKFGTLTLQNVQHQAMAFLELMKYWTWKKIYVVRGTQYHVETTGVHVEEWIAQQLNAEPASKWEKTRRSVYDLGLEYNGVAMHFAHHLSSSFVPHYRFTPMVREAWLSKMYDRYYGHYDIIVRGHVHYCNIAQISDDFAVMTIPCWQLPTPYQKKRSSFSYPDLGLAAIDIYDPGKYLIELRIIHEIKPHRVKAEVEK